MALIEPPEQQADRIQAVAAMDFLNAETQVPGETENARGVRASRIKHVRASAPLCQMLV